MLIKNGAESDNLHVLRLLQLRPG